MAIFNLRNLAVSGGAVSMSLIANAQSGAGAPTFDKNDAALDKLVEACFEMEGG